MLANSTKLDLQRFRRGVPFVVISAFMPKIELEKRTSACVPVPGPAPELVTVKKGTATATALNGPRFMIAIPFCEWHTVLLYMGVIAGNN